jgi:S-formylglutathione hydrolase
MVNLEKKSFNKVSTGTLTKYSFDSTSLNLPTNFNVFIPDSASSSPVPVLFYLAGLTCNEDTGAQKGGILNTAGKEGIAVVFPDTSPRGAGIEGEDEDWDFGTGESHHSNLENGEGVRLMIGAGFYLNATDPKWKKHYNMYDLVVKELPKVLKEADLGLDISRMSIMGHSMGGTSLLLDEY